MDNIIIDCRSFFVLKNLKTVYGLYLFELDNTICVNINVIKGYSLFPLYLYLETYVTNNSLPLNTRST